MRNTDHEVVETFASEECIEIIPSKTNVYHEENLESRELFSFENYLTHNRLPKKVLNRKPKASKRCLDMPLRLSGETSYRLPKDWESLEVILEELIGIEHLHNPNWIEYFTYLTVDVKIVSSREQQRHGGLHVDGFQGARMSEKTPVTRNYVGTTNGGTRFWNQPFVVADPEKFNVFEGFDLQKNGKLFIADEDSFYFMDAYTVHESGFAREDGERVFMRLTYDLKEFDRKGNTKNPSLNYNWKMVERNVWSSVSTPTLEDIKESPYSKKY